MYKLACDMAPGYCNSLSNHLRNGVFTKKDLPRALEVAEKACSSDADLCRTKAIVRDEIDGGRTNQDELIPIAIKWCDEFSSCDWLAAELMRGAAIRQDFERAEALVGSDCRFGVARGACLPLAKEFMKKGRLQDAQTYLKNACYAHSGEACELWARALEDEVFKPRQPYELKTALSRGCLERTAGMCERYRELYGKADEYVSELKKELDSDFGDFAYCTLTTYWGRSFAVYFEVNEEGAPIFLSDGFSPDEIPVERCVKSVLAQKKFTPPPVRVELVWSGEFE